MSIDTKDAIHVAVAGTTVTSGAASASVAVPNNSAGVRARVLRLVSPGNVYVKLGNGATTATTSDMMISANLDTYVNTQNFNTIAYLEATAGALLNITPLEA